MKLIGNHYSERVHKEIEVMLPLIIIGGMQLLSDIPQAPFYEHKEH